MHHPAASSPTADDFALVLPLGSADTAALKNFNISTRVSADSTVVLPLSNCRHCLSRGQMALCGMPPYMSSS